MSSQRPDLPRSSVYVGWLRHRRRRPIVHEFTYPLFMVLLDIDRIADLMRVSRFTSCNGWNWAAFHDRDHFGHPWEPLRERLQGDAARCGVTLPDGPIYLLTHLRYLGYCFNPVSFFYCFDRAGRLARVLAEVNNTFGGSHNYWLTPDSTDARDGERRFSAAASKALYVSPFMAPALDYRFQFTAPAARLVAHMTVHERGAGDELFDATLSLEQRAWTASAIRRALVRHPVMTAAVMAAIHWQALKLWARGLRVVPRDTTTGVSVPVDAGSQPEAEER